MKRKLRLTLLTIITIIATLAIGSSQAKAETVRVSPKKTMYTINDNAQIMYTYVESNGDYQNIFCMDYAGILNDNTMYDVSSDIYNLTDSQIEELFTTRENYNKALWVADNMIIAQGQSKEETAIMVEQLKQALHSETAINAVKTKYNLPDFNQNEMDAVINHVYSNGWYNVFYSVQQCVFWNFTKNTRPFPGLTKLDGGYDLEGKYYMWIYDGLKAVADEKGSYNSPNRNNNMEQVIYNLNMNSENAQIDIQNKKIGPFVVNGYNNDILTKNTYSVKINNNEVPSSDYEISFDGQNLYVILKSDNYDINGAKVSVNMEVATTKTTGNLLYRSGSQDIFSFHKTILSKQLVGSTDNSQFDLRLIKNIAGVWSVSDEKAALKFDLNNNELKSRNIERVPGLKNGNTTEYWKINKYPVSVSTGDIVKYAITIVNEGNVNGYATEVTDFVADGLELASKEELVNLGILNNDSEYYGWTKGTSANGFTALKTNYLQDKEILAYNPETDTVDSKVVYVYCKVTGTKADTLMKNVAAITADKAVDSKGNDIDDRDSNPESIKIEDVNNNWIGDKGNRDILSTTPDNQYFYPGKEDDDDFDTVRLQNIDLALTKQITAVEYADGSIIELSRLNNIDKNKLLNGIRTTATYNMNKTFVNVTTNSIVTYRISVYNEGSIKAVAKEITDYLPAGLEFYSSEVNGVNYNWNVTKNENGTTTITTNYLENTELDPLTNRNIYPKKYVEVKCKVTSTTVDQVLTNVAEITNYGYYVGTTYVEANVEGVDRDSVQKSLTDDASKIISDYDEKVGRRNSSTDKETTNYEDDDDFENVKIINKELDLALRKSISAVNGNTVVNGYDLTTNRLPLVDGRSASAALSSGNAKYFHDKEAIKVKVGDEITYTIRVYNEGNVNDYCGYAQVVTDYLPQGVEFVRIDDSSKQSWTTESKAGDSKVVLKYTANKTIFNNSLIYLYSKDNVTEDDQLYQTVSIVCKVTGSGYALTNRAEITSEIATDAEGNIIENITDRDSTPGSLTEEKTKLDTYYPDYNRTYGIDDTYIDFYPGEEGGKKEDDVDFEAISVEEEKGKIGIFKYEDTNKNGEFDSEDKALKGAFFALKESSNASTYVTAEVETDEQGKAVFENLDLNKTYYIVETRSPEGFKKLENAIEAKASKNDVNFADITNLVKVGNEKIEEKGKIGIFKYEDTNKNGEFDSEDKALKGAFFALKESSDATEYVTAEVETDEQGKAVFENLDLNKTYYIVETRSPEGFKKLENAVEAKASKNDVNFTDITNLVKVGNEKIEEKGKIGIFKYEDTNKNGEFDSEDKALKGAFFALKESSDATEYVTAEVETDEQGKAVFENLDLNKTYYIVETRSPEGFKKLENAVEAKASKNDVNFTDITNLVKIGNEAEEVEVETTEVSGTKTWNDNDNKLGKRPSSITVYLLANGEKVDSVEISDECEWKYTFANLKAKDENGKVIVYSIDESEVPGYSKTINGYNLVNTPVKEEIEIKGVKTWVDENNKDGIRPAVLRIKLYADGKEYTSQITTAASNWSYVFNKLPKYDEEGSEINYTIDEDNVAGYSKKIDGYNLINTHVVKQKADLALRKFITEIDGVKPEVSRVPSVDVSTIATKGTATYTHPKNALAVNKGAVVTYTLRIYNEGKIDAYPSLVKDSIPAGLEFIPGDATNTEYLWKMTDANGVEVKDPSKAKYVVTDYLSKAKNEDKIIRAYKDGKLDYKDVKVSFKVVSDDTTEKELINYAQISEETDATGTKVEDVDSIPNVWNEGEDDQDIEKIKLTYADLSLRKFITHVNSEKVNPTREPVVDVTPLLNGKTTATYTHPKDVVNVSKDDIVRYSIRIYNEGTKSEYVTLVKDSIPEGLEYIATSELNQKYNWKMVDELGNEVQFAANAKYVVTDYLSKDLIKAFDGKNLDYKDVEVEFKVVAQEKSAKEMTNYAQISAHVDQNGNESKDRDSTPDKWIDGEDDQDIETVKLTYADLALRKYITEVNNVAPQTSREPVVDVTPILNGKTTATYTHPKNTVDVKENDIVTYTLRVYNEGTKSVYASLVKDDIPQGLEFVPYTNGDGSVNDTYKWKLMDENGKEVTDVKAAKYIVTDYLAKDLIKGFNKDTMTTLDYRDVKVSFKVLAPDVKGKVITNYAQISEEKDQTGKIVEDIDSKANVWNDGEDDQDTEQIKLIHFDLALQKWVSKAIIIENGSERVVKTGYTAETDPEPVVKVDLKKSKINNVVVKFEYQIQVTNQGEIAGYANEVEDRIPEGLKFVAEDNNNWQLVNGKVVTHALENTLLQPGQSETVSIVLTWINKSNNLGLKTNTAEITQDSDEDKNEITDIDSTPNNDVDEEDDQDTATVMLTIKTGAETMYIGLIVAVISILGIGTFGIKKYVLK